MHATRTAPWRMLAPNRRGAVVWTAALVVLLLVPGGAALAATTPQVAPLLDAPAHGASSFVEGSPMTFQWRGTLQGATDATDRSFFRLEVARSTDVPAGAQSAWPIVEATQDSVLGEASASMSLGVPAAGTYRWRVCAWGVVDVLAANIVQQIPGGCSAARRFVTAAAVVTKAPIGETTMETKVATPGPVVKVQQQRAPTPAPQPAEPAPVVKPAAAAPEQVTPAEVVKAPVPTTYQVLEEEHDVDSDGPAVGLGHEGLRADTSARREGVGGAISRGLTSTLPLLPIPFWALALLLACFPMARFWRRDALAMFDWSDGSIDGNGDLNGALGDLTSVHRDRDLKHGSTTVDGEAAALVAAGSESDRGRHAA